MTPPAAAIAEQDLETRERLLASSAALFAERGFAKVTVRDICTAARANVAAVNYHFDGKVGLYEQVIRRAIGVMQETTRDAIRAGEGRPPREQLSQYIRVFLRRVFEGRDSWIHQMMMREMSEPTPALDIVLNDVIRPRMHYLSQVVSALMKLPVDDVRVKLSVMSVHTQCLAMLRSPVGERLGMIRASVDNIEDIAEHIVRFSLAGIRAAAKIGDL